MIDFSVTKREKNVILGSAFWVRKNTHHTHAHARSQEVQVNCIEVNNYALT